MFTRSIIGSKAQAAEAAVKPVDTSRPSSTAEAAASVSQPVRAPQDAGADQENQKTPEAQKAQKSLATQEVQETKHYSIISNDLTIMGHDLKIISKGGLKVDGAIQGEIRGVDVIVSENGMVTGTISAQSVVVDGKVMGTVQASMVTLRKKAHVEGDVHHTSLTIEEGAVFDGRSRRHEDAGELAPVLDVNGQMLGSSSPSAPTVAPSSPADTATARQPATTTPPPLSG